MKKLIVLFIAIFALFAGNVKAASTYKATMTHFGVGGTDLSINLHGTTRKGTLYIANLKEENHPTYLAFCVDRGKHSVRNGIYVRTTNTIKDSLYIRRAYAFATGVYQPTSSGYTNLYYNYSQDKNVLRYIIAQSVIWLVQEGEYSSAAASTAASSAIVSYYASKLGITTSEATARYLGDTYNTLMTEFYRTTPYMGPLYTYKYIYDDGSYQRFISPLPLDMPPETVEKTYCPSPDDSIDITDCIQNNQDKTNPEQYCISQNCPNSDIPACSGGVTKVVVENESACANDNQNHDATYKEVVDYEQCGYATEDGEPIRQLGSYAYLYCKEQVTRSFPGGISSPISLGTSIVWPTSSATEHTIWGNLYSLSYIGHKSCKIKIAPNTKISEKPGDTLRNYATSLNNNPNRNRFETIRTSQGGNCTNAYAGELNNADANLSRVQSEYDRKKASYDSAVSDYNNKKAACDSASAKLEDAKQKCYNANKSKDACETSCKNNTGGHPTAYNECMKTCAKIDTSVCKSVSGLNYAESSACSGVSSAQNSVNYWAGQVSSANSAVESAQRAKNNIIAQRTACDTYMGTYNQAITLLNDIAAVQSTTFNKTDLYQFQSDTAISYNDPEYGNTYNLIGTTNYSCDGCEGTSSITYSLTTAPRPNQLMNAYNQLVSQIEDRRINIEASVVYSLPNGLYNYIDKKTNKPLMSPIGEYITVGYSNLPTSFNANVNRRYNLNVHVNSLGEDGKFTDLANRNPYVCNYSVSKIPTDECVCPEGTKHAGEDLYCKIYSAGTTEETMTCADAQVLYCDSDETFDEVCTDEKFCPGDKSIKITSCLNNGHTYNYCVNTLCNGNGSQDYYCPRGTYNDGMNIKPCVFANIGLGLEQAINYCVDTVCPARGINIIYRPISLRNPFPGKAATGSTVDFSLDHIRGRHPGANWNSKLLVRNQILYNRNVEGNQVYNKEPLYSFILDGDTIRQIRSYNDSRESSGGYADFTLDCNSSGIACLSNKFLRESVSGLVGGVCKTASSSNFYVCSES